MRNRLTSRLSLLFLTFAAALLVFPAMAVAEVAAPDGTTASAPTIQSDLADYPPGATVTLTGSNWQPGESVHINVNDTYGASWSRNVDVTAVASGNITDSFNLPEYFVSDYDVTATGAQSGTVRTSFTDANPSGITVDPTSNTVTQGQTTSAYAVRVLMGGNADPCTTTLSASGLPTGATASFSVNPRTGNTNYTSNLTVSTTNATPTGTHTFNVQMTRGTNCQGSGNFSQQLTLVVTSGNTAPVAVNDSATINEDNAINSINVLGNDTDAQGNTLSVSSFTQPTNGTVTKNADNTLKYVPSANFNGTDTFTYKANDGTVDSSNSGTVTVTVDPVNDAPSFTKGANQTVNEDASAQTVTGWATAISSGPSNESTQTVSFTATNDNNALFSAQPQVSPNGTLTYTPAANASGTATVTVRAHDSGGTANGGVDTSASQTFTITVTAVDDNPVAANDNKTVAEDDAATTIDVRANDTDIDGGPKTITSVTQPTNGTVAITNNGADLTYKPNADYCNGGSPTDDFNYTLNGGSTAKVAVTVTCVNDAPKAADDSATTDEDTSALIDVKANDTDADGDTLTITNVTNPAHGTAVVDNGKVNYTPAANYNGPDSFSYTVSDGNGGTDTADVSVTVKAVNDAPDAVNDSAETAEDTAKDISVLGNDTDVDGDSLSVSSVGSAGHGTVTNNNDGTINYKPNANYNGPDSFTYTVSDGKGGSDTATVSITVTAVNDAPVGTDDSYTTLEDTDLTVLAANGLLKNDTDVENDQLRVDDADATATGINPVSGPSHGTLTLNADGSFTYKPNADYNGSDSFTYRVCDNGSPTPKCSVETANVNIKIDPVNDAPVAVNDSATTNEDTAASINVITNDTDVDNTNAQLSVSSFTQPTHGTVTKNVDGTLKYTPAADYNGSDSFTYKAKDAGLDSNSATVSITVNAVNDAPVAVDDTATTPEDTPVKILASELLGNDSTGPANESGQTLTIKSVTKGQNGQAVLNTDGSVTFTPAANFNGAASFDYTVCDDGVPSRCYEGTATVRVTVSAVNDAPSFTAGANETVAEDSGPQTVPGWASGISAGPADESGQAVDFLVSSDNDPLFSVAPEVSPNGALSYTPAANASGTATVTVRAHDSGGTANGGVDTSAPQTFTITVNAVNDNPAIASVTNNGPANEGSPATIKVTANDVDGDTLSYAFDCDNNSTFEVGPQAASSAQCTFNDEGAYRVNVKVTDGNGGSATDSTSVVVNNVNPTIGALTTTGSGTACLGSNNVATLSFSITDPGTSDTQSGTINWGDGTITPFTGSSVTQQHSYGAGTYNITVNASDNDGGNAAPKTTTTANQVSLLYKVSELQDPVNRTGMTMSVFKHGSTVPLKVLITDCNNQPVNGLVPRISFTKVNPSTPAIGVNEALSTQPNDTNFLMRDAGNGQYIYNLNTKTLADGDATYNATITDSKTPATYGPKTSQNFGLRTR